MNMPDHYLNDLPYCGSCLQDFDLYQYPCAFSCQHFFCTLCLPKLSDNHGYYKCIYDGSLTAEDSVRGDPAMFQVIEEIKKAMVKGPLETELDEKKTEVVSKVNYQMVTCRVGLQLGACPQPSLCRFDHSQRSLAISRLFSDLETSVCWECRYCLLTISRKVMKCPVCDFQQEELAKPMLSTQTRPSIRENKTGTNVTLDQSLVTEEERPKPQPPIISINEQQSPIEEASKPEEPARSACCIVQ